MYDVSAISLLSIPERRSAFREEAAITHPELARDNSQQPALIPKAWLHIPATVSLIGYPCQNIHGEESKQQLGH